MRYIYFRDDKTMALIHKIASHIKVVQTRPRNVLKSIIGQRVGLVVTLPNKKRFLFGYATVGQPIVYDDAIEFMEDFDRHQIAVDSVWFKEKGIGYPLLKPEFIPLTPAPEKSYGNRSYYTA